MKQSLDSSLPKMCPVVRPFDQDGPHSRTQLNIGPYGKFTYKPSCLEPVAQLEPNFDGIVIGWSSSKIVSGSRALSHQDGRHSAVVLLLKAALIEVSDYRLLGASGFFFIILHSINILMIMCWALMLLWRACVRSNKYSQICTNLR